MYVLLFFFLFASSSVYSTPQDTIPPTYTWISPEKYTILTTNTIRLCVDARDNENGSGIKKVIFYACYSNIKGEQQLKQIIGEVDAFPYELIWDCSHIEDQDADKLTYSAGPLPAGAEVSDGIFTWTPNYDQAGIYPMAFSVSDGHTEVSQLVMITVNNSNRRPIIELIPDRQILAGHTVAFNVNANDPDNDPLRLSVLNNPVPDLILILHYYCF